MEPGDTVYKLRTFHLSLADGSCVVEIDSGVQRKDGTVEFSTRTNVELDRETVATTIGSAVRDAVLALLPEPYKNNVT